MNRKRKALLIGAPCVICGTIVLITPMLFLALVTFSWLNELMNKSRTGISDHYIVGVVWSSGKPITTFQIVLMAVIGAGLIYYGAKQLKGRRLPNQAL